MPPKTTTNKDQTRNIVQLEGQIKSLTCELLKERITRIDFQLQLLTQWQQQSQQELNRLLNGEESSRSPEGQHG
ncbi:MAG: hypothetical protein PHU44_17800 [Syntrophales bacterium]|nr:hypothetical protein [Syntrophales bacterium]MDD5641521.1 hypothetical protein [Syntrophales bacterium]